MIYQVTHTTRYRYNKAVSQCFNLAHLLPRNTYYQHCSRAQISVNPLPVNSSDRVDYFGNRSFYFSLQQPHDILEVTAVSEVEIIGSRQNLTLDLGPSCEEVIAALHNCGNPDVLTACEFALDSPLIKTSTALADYGRSSFRDELPFLSCVQNLNTRIFQDFAYDPESTDVATPLAEVLENRSGVCQDFAHLAIGCLRSLGFPARYVSGYLETLPPPGVEKLQGADASHAWFSVWSANEGWFDFDPTNNVMAGEQHITTAWGRDYSDVVPLKGTVFGGGSKHRLEVEVDVERLRT